jgi:hypothetical protein
LTEDQFGDCALGMWCSSIVGPGVGVGRCEEYGPAPEPYAVALGGDCSGPGAQCAEGSHCHIETSLCTADKAVGEPCEGEICEASSFCARDSEPWTCTPRLGEGAECPEAWMVCEASTFCNHSSDLAVPTCQVLAELGEPCPNPGRVFGECQSRYCSESGTCAELPPEVCVRPTPG